MCPECAEAADEKDMSKHCGRDDCTCQHQPVGTGQVERD